MSINAANTHFWALFFTAAVSVQATRMSVTVRVLTEITRGIPALVTHAVDLDEAGLLLMSQSAQMRIGIWDFSRVPGLVPEWPRSCSRLRSLASLREIVAVPIVDSFATASSVRSSSPQAAAEPPSHP